MGENYIQNQFVTYEIALKLKELGFDEECLAWFFQKEFKLGGHIFTGMTNSIQNSIDLVTAPIWQQVIDWFREKHNVYIATISYTNPVKIGDKILYEILIGTKENNFDPTIDNSEKRLKFGFENNEFSYYNLYNSYEEAREQAILKAIELCKK